jgi:hypothetical protein
LPWFLSRSIFRAGTGPRLARAERVSRIGIRVYLNKTWRPGRFSLGSLIRAGLQKHPAGKTPTRENSSEPFVAVNNDFILAKSNAQTNGEMALREAGGASRSNLYKRL